MVCDKPTGSYQRKEWFVINLLDIVPRENFFGRSLIVRIKIKKLVCIRERKVPWFGVYWLLVRLRTNRVNLSNKLFSLHAPLNISGKNVHTEGATQHPRHN